MATDWAMFVFGFTILSCASIIGLLLLAVCAGFAYIVMNNDSQSSAEKLDARPAHEAADVLARPAHGMKPAQEGGMMLDEDAFRAGLARLELMQQQQQRRGQMDSRGDLPVTIELDTDSPKRSQASSSRTPLACAKVEEELTPPRPTRSSSRETHGGTTLQGHFKLEYLQQGYASQLAVFFDGTQSFHFDNVATVVNAFGLEAMDICYCFLCLEKVAGARAGSADLSLKKHGLGPYTARVWTAALARFVFTAQGLNNALKEELLEMPCQSWKYELPSFLAEVVACESTFKRKHGNLLLRAFADQDLRLAEVDRAYQSLGALGVASLPRASRLAIKDSWKPLPPSVEVGKKRLALADGKATDDAGSMRKRTRSTK
eukprot:TRINITY_DN51248_c0_g1_i1.p1 TRINITY_DN51248_c0_g1~~TRINITY_DN51248_c0_g1_i1.p1  ORF type:complete len:401 (-),score=98.60 TRINITY_DN51248_c0_g1_i1:149-1270(-)